MIKLQANFGYLIHNKITDTYAKVIYLPDNANLDNFEEVIDDTIDARLRIKMEEVEKKEESLTKVAKVVANSVTDDVVALEIQEFYDIWQPNVLVKAGQYIRHDDILYKVLTEHNTQEGWTPDAAPSLFAKVLADPTGENIFEWQQPDSTNPYMTGDKVTYNGVTYISIVDNNVWEPGVYGWEVVEES